MDGKPWVKELLNRQRSRESSELSKAQQLAQAAGKEPFDFERVARALGARGATRGQDQLDALKAEWERSYYVHFPQLTSVADFIEKMQQLQAQPEG
jgi:hypothetical protein